MRASGPEEPAMSSFPEAARALEEKFDEIYAGYIRRLQDERNLLAVGGRVPEEDLRSQARLLLERAAAALRGERSAALTIEEEIRQNVEAAKEPLVQHPDESFRAGVALCKAALETVGAVPGLSGRPPAEILKISLAVQEAVMDRVARVAMVSYVDYLLTKITETQMEERRRFSRELHDRVAHTMALVSQSLQLYEALKEKDASAAGEKLERARTAAQEAMSAVRELALELRESEDGHGLEAALDNLMKAAVPKGVGFEIYFEGSEDRLPRYVRDQLYMILREGIRNAVTHSGADKIRVEVRISAGEVVAAVIDDGAGFDVSGTEACGVGLRSMEERAKLLGGSFEVRSAPGNGTRAEVRVPLKRGKKRL